MEVSFLMDKQMRGGNNKMQVADDLDSTDITLLSYYALDFYPPARLQGTPGVIDMPVQENPGEYSPTFIAQDALIQWNQYLATSDENYRSAFLKQPHKLIEHEVLIGN